MRIEEDATVRRYRTDDGGKVLLLASRNEALMMPPDAVGPTQTVIRLDADDCRTLGSAVIRATTGARSARRGGRFTEGDLELSVDDTNRGDPYDEGMSPCLTNPSTQAQMASHQVFGDVTDLGEVRLSVAAPGRDGGAA